MSKWKCGICNSEFENYHAQGFDNIIYCPLCYYKELYKRDKKEIDRLNNIINECSDDILKELKENHHLSYGVALSIRNKLLDYKELKENK